MSQFIGEDCLSNLCSPQEDKVCEAPGVRTLTRADVELLAHRIVNYLESETADPLRGRRILRVADLIQGVDYASLASRPR